VIRANRAHLNAVESFAPFAAVVLIGRVAGISDSVTVVQSGSGNRAQARASASNARLRVRYLERSR
jgi:uncharacterized MAPEG superfamily protein